MDVTTAYIIALIVFTLIYLVSNWRLSSENTELIQKYKKSLEANTDLNIDLDKLTDKYLNLERENLELKNKKNPENQEFQQLLLDLMQGRGLVEVRRIDPNSIFLRSVKDLK